MTVSIEVDMETQLPGAGVESISLSKLYSKDQVPVSYKDLKPTVWSSDPYTITSHNEARAFSYWSRFLEFDRLNVNTPGAQPNELSSLLNQKLSGHMLLDLACGSRFTGMIDLLQRSGVSAYIGVDVNLDGGDKAQTERLNPYHNIANEFNFPSETHVPLALLQADMLHVLSLLPSDSCNITINQVDAAIVNNMPYKEALVAEMLRVLRPEGLLFGSNAPCLLYMAKKYASALQVSSISCQHVILLKNAV